MARSNPATIVVNGVTYARVASSAPAEPKAEAKRTYATKAERLAGEGFACSCGRTNLRVAPHEGSYHTAPDGTTHRI
jgi:hypothetical protein